MATDIPIAGGWLSWARRSAHGSTPTIEVVFTQTRRHPIQHYQRLVDQIVMSKQGPPFPLLAPVIRGRRGRVASSRFALRSRAVTARRCSTENRCDGPSARIICDARIVVAEFLRHQRSCGASRSSEEVLPDIVLPLHIHDRWECRWHGTMSPCGPERPQCFNSEVRP